MNNTIIQQVDNLITEQLNNWPLAKNNFTGLQKVVTREIDFNNKFKIKIQFNPERIRSSAAKVDAKSIQERKCFLCPAHLPEEQKGVEFLDKYLILVNPFPIFKRHLTIPLKEHTDQRIEPHFGEMMQLAKALPGFAVFYNGPLCGASAPDHFHFQAGNTGFMPIEEEIGALQKTILKQTVDNQMLAIDVYLRKAILINGNDSKIIEQWFKEILELLKDYIPSDPEPMLNILTQWTGAYWQVIIFPRKKHRPDQFFKEGNEQILLSPASVDFGGVLITPREEDFNKLDEKLIRDIFHQVTMDDCGWEELKKKLSSLN